MVHSSSFTTIERKTYSLLEWLGDVGGLFDGISIIASSIVSSFSAFALKAQLLTYVMKEQISNNSKTGSEESGPIE